MTQQNRDDLQDLRNVAEHVGETIEHTVTSAYQAIEDGVVGAYKKVEDTVVGGFTRMTDGFVERFIAREGESAEEAKARLAREQAEREEAQRAAMERRAQETAERIEKANALGGVHIDVKKPNGDQR